MRTLGPHGDEGEADFSFLRVGKTSRTEVLEKLAWMDTGYRNDRRFWGRWTGSQWERTRARAGIFNTSTRPEGQPVHNLVVEFDQTGTVERFRLVPEPELFNELSGWIQRGEEPPLDLTKPLEVSVFHRHLWAGTEKKAILVLGRDFFEFKEEENRNHNFQVPAAQVAKFSLPKEEVRYRADAGEEICTLRFRRNTPAGRKMTVRSDLLTALTLVKYVEQVRKQMK